MGEDISEKAKATTGKKLRSRSVLLKIAELSKAKVEVEKQQAVDTCGRCAGVSEMSMGGG